MVHESKQDKYAKMRLMQNTNDMTKTYACTYEKGLVKFRVLHSREGFLDNKWAFMVRRQFSMCIFMSW